tara:strand:+ start:2513 stop:3160 length:648 start_codon:yes stop_codon:yes gene_type:complete
MTQGETTMVKHKGAEMMKVVLENMRKLGIEPTPATMRVFVNRLLNEVRQKSKRLHEAADLDPEAVQKALEEASGQLAVLQDFLSPDNMKRFEAAAEFVPQLEEFFGSLNTHFELQKQKEEEAAEEAEAAAAQAEQEAEAEAEEAAAEAEEEAAEQEAEAEEAGETPEAAAEEGAGLPDTEEGEAATEEPAEEPEEAEELQEGYARWKKLAGILRG